MASQAQIDANRRNSERSTGPKSEAGKARAKLNALKDGSHARTVSRVLPQENAVELDERIKRWIIDLKPRNDAERALVIHAAELAWTLDRAKRCEKARLANRVLIAGDEAAELADRVSCDTSAAGERLRRELTAKGRELRQTLELLMKMQKGEKNGQTDGDDGKMKDDKCAETETETTRRIGGTGGNAGKEQEGERAENETDREAGAATNLASRKRPRDKSRSMTALEMMMSGRLDEQGFEKYFADPPAALVVIKGLQKLAERNVLPGRALVAARCAGERPATGQLGTQNGNIEANDDETQTADPQEDKAHSPIVGVEKRSHLWEGRCQARRCRFCGAGFPHIPFRRRLRSIWPISDLSAAIRACNPHTSSEPKAEGDYSSSIPAVYEALADVT
jgi:hypothetical protein